MSLIDRLHKRGLINPPSFVVGSIQYEVMVGSDAYGVSSGESDQDISGFCIPRKDTVFPHLRGEVQGFGKQIKRFEQYQQHHVEDKQNNKMYDFTIYNIVKYFQLVMDGNPTLLETLYVPVRCILYSTKIGNMVRENRKLFLHKGCWHRFRGYSYSQLHKADIKNPIGKRKEIIEEIGMDTKFLYHVVRLLNECEMLLETGEMNLERDREMLKEIRRGGWTIEQVKDYFTTKEKYLEELYNRSTLPWGPDENRIKKLLFDCLEEYYGKLGNSIVKPESFDNLKKDLRILLEKYEE